MALIKPTPLFGEKQPSPPELREQFLFLLEFYVHEIRGDRLAKLNQMFFVPTSVNFQFLDFKDNYLEVTPVDPMFEPQAGISDNVEYFYSGRSIMFSVAQHVVIEKMTELKVKVIVKKKMPENINPDIVVGEAEIDMTKQFAALRKEMLQCWYVGAPPPQVFENDVPLFFKEDLIGTVKVFIRLSSYGQSITTEFEAPNGNKSSYVFKGNKINERGLSYKCRVIDSREMDICKDSEDNLSNPCQICQPPRHPCTPCGLSIGAVAKSPRMEMELGFDKCLETPGGNFQIENKGLERGVARKEAVNCEPDSANRVVPIQSSRGPSQPCGKAVVLKVSGLLDVEGENRQPTVTVAAECEEARDSEPDPNHDVFILRIGKKGLVGPDEKSDLQLEMRTPKGPERRPPIRHETREAQTEDEAKGAKKAKGGKGKKKKK